MGRGESKRKYLLPSGSRSSGQTPASAQSLTPTLDQQLAITGSSLIKPQSPAFRQFPLSFSPLRVIQREAELDPTSRSQASKGDHWHLTLLSPLPPQEDPCLTHSGRHSAWRAQGSCPPPQDLGHLPIRVGSGSAGLGALPWEEIPATPSYPPAGLQ